MEQVVEVYQLMPDNIIRIHTGETGKKIEVLADYKKEKHFSARLTFSEANWLASELNSPHGINWKRLENQQVLRIIRRNEFRQIVLSDIIDGQEISAAPIGVILDEVLDRVIGALKTI
ncbi:MAG TPA: hypothetical protein VGW12_07770 [Pyrinomonadaceae bacterium]|nr:hypothetical protein [Pyrinomonadaceae bacterium]